MSQGPRRLRPKILAAALILGTALMSLVALYQPSVPAQAQPLNAAGTYAEGRSAPQVLGRQAMLPALYSGLPSEQTNAALARTNDYRALAGVEPLSFNPSIEAAAQAHADYYVINAADSSAQVYGMHGEVAGKPGYTGLWPWDRLAAAGYPWFGGSEVIHFRADAVTSVDDWMSGIFHRILLLDPLAREGGYASSRSGRVAIDVLDMGNGPSDPARAAAPYVLAYPADGQTDVPPLWNGAEYPDPLPAGASKPVGYPFTLQGVGGKLWVDAIEMWNPAGEPVAVHPNPAECGTFDCFALVAVSPLEAGATYTVRAFGVVGSIPFDQSWQFTTAP